MLTYIGSCVWKLILKNSKSFWMKWSLSSSQDWMLVFTQYFTFLISRIMSTILVIKNQTKELLIFFLTFSCFQNKYCGKPLAQLKTWNLLEAMDPKVFVQPIQFPKMKFSFWLDFPKKTSIILKNNHYWFSTKGKV